MPNILIQFVILCSLGLFGCIETRQIEFSHDLNFLNTSQRTVYIRKDGLTTVHHKAKLGIVNGNPAERGQACYVVFLQFTDGNNRFWSCTGSLISPTVIVTAAHCLIGAILGTGVVGTTDLGKPLESGSQKVIFTIGQIKIHEKYDYQIHNDIGTITLLRPVELNEYVCTVKVPECSATKKHVTRSDIFTVCGWGLTSDKSVTTQLMCAQVHGQDQNECANYYMKNVRYSLAESQMCTSGADGKSTCSGDSGGPLVSNGVLQGVVSLGINTCEARAPSVYTDVSCFMSWLCPIINQE